MAAGVSTFPHPRSSSRALFLLSGCFFSPHALAPPQPLHIAFVCACVHTAGPLCHRCSLLSIVSSFSRTRNEPYISWPLPKGRILKALAKASLSSCSSLEIGCSQCLCCTTEALTETCACIVCFLSEGMARNSVQKRPKRQLELWWRPPSRGPLAGILSRRCSYTLYNHLYTHLPCHPGDRDVHVSSSRFLPQPLLHFLCSPCNSFWLVRCKAALILLRLSFAFPPWARPCISETGHSFSSCAHPWLAVLLVSAPFAWLWLATHRRARKLQKLSTISSCRAAAASFDIFEGRGRGWKRKEGGARREEGGERKRRERTEDIEERGEKRQRRATVEVLSRENVPSSSFAPTPG